MRRRPYENASDLTLLQAFTVASSAKTDGCGYLHPGDIAHHLFNGNRAFAPDEVMTIWEDDAGVAAWVLVGPRHRSYDAQVRHDLRGGAFEREVLEYSDVNTVAAMRRHGVEGDRILGDAFRCDHARIELISEMGWVPDGDPPYVIIRVRIADVPEPSRPAGYSIRAVAGVSEACTAATAAASSTPATARIEYPAGNDGSGTSAILARLITYGGSPSGTQPISEISSIRA